MAATSSDYEVLSQVGQDFVIKVARVVPEAIVYGIYLVLVYFLVAIYWRHGIKMRGSWYLIPVTILMFLGSTIFLCFDVTDLVLRLQVILQDNPDQSVADRLDVANAKIKKVFWAGEMMFIFMLCLGDSVVVWRTWAIYKGDRRLLALPIATWVGSVVAALFELGCDIHTSWGLLNLGPDVASAGAEKCAHADLSSYTLSFVTNIFCTLLIAFKAWQHRKIMSKYLGSAQRKTQVERIMTLLVESGSAYLILYTLQAVPIYNAVLSNSANVAFNVVNAIIQQAMGMYPTAIIVLVHMQRSLWDANEVSQMVYASRAGGTTTVGGTNTAVTCSTHTATIAMAELNKSGELDHEKENDSVV